MNAPEIGSTVYLDTDKRDPHIVLNRCGTTLYLCPINMARTTHQGNVYNKHGENEWRV